MPAYHLTGPNGAGKSAVGRVLQARGFRVIESDFEPGFSSWVNIKSGEKVTDLPPQPIPKKWHDAHAWRWDKKKVTDIIAAINDEPVFIVGGAYNEKEFYKLFKKRFGFFIDSDALVRRLKLREPNRWLNGSAELNKALDWNKRSADFNLDHGAIPIDGSLDPEVSTDTILRHVEEKDA